MIIIVCMCLFLITWITGKWWNLVNALQSILKKCKCLVILTCGFLHYRFVFGQKTSAFVVNIKLMLLHSIVPGVSFLNATHTLAVCYCYIQEHIHQKKIM